MAIRLKALGENRSKLAPLRRGGKLIPFVRKELLHKLLHEKEIGQYEKLKDAAA